MHGALFARVTKRKGLLKNVLDGVGFSDKKTPFCDRLEDIKKEFIAVKAVKRQDAGGFAVPTDVNHG
jgi:hypothetical protein